MTPTQCEFSSPSFITEPEGSWPHASLRPQREPRQFALQDQLLSLRRLDKRQGVLNIATKVSSKMPIQALRHDFTIKVVTDGCHHVLDHLEPEYRSLVEEVPTQPHDPKHLGFEAQRILVDHLSDNYDLYVYLEDDLLIHDQFFFHKIFWFQKSVGERCVLMPHRYESYWKPAGMIAFLLMVQCLSMS